MLTYYYLDIGVSDGSADDYISVEVKVKDVEEDGVVDLLWNQPQVGTPIVASLSDPDGEVSGVTWQWARSTSNTDNWTDITTNGTSATYTPVAADNGNYLRATASYTDRRDSGKSANGVSDRQSRAIPEDNTAPTITGDTSVEIEVNENTPAGTHLGAAFQASDTDNDEIRYFLGVTDDDGAFNIDPNNGQLKVKDPLDHESKETYSLSVFARDPTLAGTTSSSPAGTVAVTITVTDVNERPKVTGDFDPEYQENSESLLVTTLTGVDEDDKYGPFHQNSSVSWLIDGLGDSDGDFFYMDDDGDYGHLEFLVPPDFENPADQNRDNVYDISITAYTGRYDMTFFNVSVTVTDRDDDGIVTGPSSVNYPERGTRSVATYTISDTTQQTISWSVAGTDRGQFTIDAGVLRFGSPPDYDSPSDHDKNNKYSITVTAHGTNVTASMNVVVTVTEHNVPPQISGPASPTFAENGSGTVATYSATDGDDDPITWSLSGVDVGDLSIHSTDGTLTFRSPPDFEGPADDDTNNDYDVTVQAYDGTITVDHPVTVTVTKVNEAPSFPTAADSRNVDENTATEQPIGAPVVATDVDAGDSWTYSLDATSLTVFGIDTSTGQLKTKAALDHETKDTYSVTVTARDRGGLTGSITVTINVGDVNEAPEFPSTETGARTIPENTQADQPIGDPVQADDPDDGDALTYTLSGTDVASFDIDSMTGQLKTKAALDHKDKDSYLVTVVATDTASAADRIDVTITVTDVNEAPAFPASETGARSIPENTAAGQNIGSAVAAEDPDDGDTLTYSLDETAAASFEIDTSTGQLKTKAALDYEGGTTSYTVTVSVQDGKDANGDADTTVDATQDVTITVTDENETIDLTGDANPDYPENGTGAVATYTATDGDGGTIDWGLSGADVSLFDITGGVLTFQSAPDYEMPTDQGGDNKYQITVQASTLSDAPATLAVTVTVTDVNEPPAFPAATDTREIAENTPAGRPIEAAVEADDPDAHASLAYTLGGTDAASFDIETTTGQLKTKADLNFEGGTTTYTVTVSVTDGKNATGASDSAVDDTIDVTITVTDANDAPTFNSGPTTTISVAENTVAGTSIGAALTANDQDNDPLAYSLDATSAAGLRHR